MVMKLRWQPPQQWRQAKCRSLGVKRNDDPFFSEDIEETQWALDFCNGADDGKVCPVREDCLIFALMNNCRDGVWGGCSETTRKAIRRKYPLGRGKEPRPEWGWKTEKEALNGLKIEDVIDEGLDEEEI